MGLNNKEKAVKQMKLKEEIGDFWENEGVVKYHADGYKHFLVKSAICFVLRKNGHDFATEHEFPNGRICDVLDLETFHVYEIETNASESDVKEKLGNFWDYDGIRDTLVIDPSDAPDDIHGIRDWVEERLLV